MSRTERTSPTGAAVVIGAMIGVIALAGCSAGQVTQTSRQATSVGGASATVGGIAVRDAQIEFGDGVEGGFVHRAGSSAALQMAIVNVGPDADRLISATSDLATSVQISGDPVIPGGQVLTVDGGPAPAAPESTSTASPSADGEEAPATTSVATIPTAGPAGAEQTAQIVLVGLNSDVRAGLTYPVVLVFERAGSIQLDVPVGNATAPREDEPAE